jgi:peptidoglycan hydrolase-like protein with peptidoglycan-binding domain
MSRTLFDIGAQGQLIVDLQTSLKGLGFGPSTLDGLYGNDTAAAVRGFQMSASQQATGAVTDEQWTPITGTAVPDVEVRALQLTSAFEGHGYGLAQGNWDGAWLTWGIVGFTLKHGEVQTIITNVDRRGTGCVDQAFGSDAAQLRHIVAAPAAEQQAWANSITVGARVAEPWRTHFAQFGAFPEVQAEQRARVRADYFVPALQTAAALGLQSELGIALCFDIHVQNGGVATAVREAVKGATAGAQEPAIREALANAVADHSRPEFQNDVRQRKMAIAQGQGVVHGRRVVLTNWGLADVPAVVA